MADEKIYTKDELYAYLKKMAKIQQEKNDKILNEKITELSNNFQNKINELEKLNSDLKENNEKIISDNNNKINEFQNQLTEKDNIINSLTKKLDTILNLIQNFPKKTETLVIDEPIKEEKKSKKSNKKEKIVESLPDGPSEAEPTNTEDKKENSADSATEEIDVDELLKGLEEESKK